MLSTLQSLIEREGVSAPSISANLQSSNHKTKLTLSLLKRSCQCYYHLERPYLNWYTLGILKSCVKILAAYFLLVLREAI